MLSGKIPLEVKPEISNTSREQPLKKQRLDADKHHEELVSFFGVRGRSSGSSRGSDDLPQVIPELQDITFEQEKRKADQEPSDQAKQIEDYSTENDALTLDEPPEYNNQEGKRQEAKTGEKRKATAAPEIDDVPLKEKVLKTNHAGPINEDKGKQSEAVQEQDRSEKPVTTNKARQVEGYYSNDDVTILLDALLKHNGFERIRGGDQQDIVKNLQADVNTRTMVLPPIAEGSEEAIAGLIRDITRANNHGIEQILIPVNMPNIHWYTIQLLMLQSPDGYSLEARIHDSLGIRKSSVIVEKLAAGGIAINSHIEGNLPKIQSLAKNAYCGGYTARLIANLALDGGMTGEEAWGCANNIDQVLRQEDVNTVSEHNSANAGSFGRRAVALQVMLDAANYMSAIRSVLAEEKKFKLLQELEAGYEAIPVEIKIRIKSIKIPKAPEELFAIVRDLHASLPLLKVLFQTNAQGEIDENAKLDTNIEIDHLHKIMAEFQKKFFQLEGLGIAEAQDDGAEPADQKMAHKEAEANATPQHDPSNTKLSDEESEAIREGLASSESLLKMIKILHKVDHPDVATFLYNIGTAHGKLGNAEKCLDYHYQALKMRQALYPDNHPDVARSLYDLGVAYQKLGNKREALDCFEQALKMRQALYPDNHPDVARSLYDLGVAYQKLGNKREALDCFEQALKMRQALYPDNHPDVARSLYDLGVAYQKLGNKREALDCFEQALKMRQALYPDNHPDVARYLYSLGAAYRELEDNSKSLDYFEQALKVRQALYPDNHPDVADSLNNVGIAYCKLNNNINALAYFEQALKMRQALYKGNHPDVVRSLNNVGFAYRNSEDDKNALYYFEQALKMMQALYKGNHPDVVDSFNNVGVAYQRLGHNRKALDHFEQALRMGQALYQGNHPGVAYYLNNAGIAYKKLGDNEKAFDYLEQALRMKQALHQGNHPGVALSLYNLGLAYQESGYADKSIEYLNRALAMSDAINRSVDKPQEKDKEEQEEFKGQGTLSHAANSYPEYYNGGLDQILGLRLNRISSNSNAVVLKSWYFKEGLDSAEKLVQDVTAAFSYGNTRIVLAPVNLYNKHWLGLLFRNPVAMVDVIYMDSEQRTILPGLRAKLEDGLSINGYESKFLEARLTPQSYNNCGYELIENFAYYLTGTRATQEGALYLHSLLVENSLLDPKEYSLKIEENNRLIGFLSNTAPLPIRSIGVLFMPSSDLIRGPLKAFGYPHVKQEYNNGALGADGQAALNLFPAIEQFNRLANKWVLDKLQQVNAGIYKTTLGFKGLGLAVDSARLVYDPELDNAKKVALDVAQLYGMAKGVNGYSALVSGAEVAYQLHLGEYQKACDVAAGTVSSMALPVILAYANKPHLGFVYSLFVAASTAYNALENAYSFALELLDGSQASASKLMAGLDSRNNSITALELEL